MLIFIMNNSGTANHAFNAYPVNVMESACF